MTDPARTFTKTTNDGRTAVITLDDKLVWHVTLDGQPYTHGNMYRLPHKMRPATHAIGSRKVLGLLPDEAAALERILDAARANRTVTPAARRAQLKADLDEAVAAWQAARAHAIDNDDWSRIGPAEEAMAAADDALAAFDREHPEFIAAIAKEAREMHRRAIDNAFNN